MDKILIKGLRCRAHVGVPEKERLRRQKILVDLELQADLSAAGRGDRVEKTIDYAAVAARVKRFIEKGSFRLVEAMAEQAARLVLRVFEPQTVRIKIRKFSVPGVKSVGVEIIRDRKRKSSASPKAGLR